MIHGADPIEMAGYVYIVSAPSGAGKTSLVRELLAADARVKLSVSFTTRPPRPGEQDGREYNFVARETFESMLQRGEFIESALVHGNYYGTCESWVRNRLREGTDILLEIDWQGAQQVRRRIESTLSIFILPPSLAELEKRLRARAQDSDDVIARRLAAAREEIGHAAEFDYVIINDRFDEARADLIAVLRSSRLVGGRQLDRVTSLLAS